MSHCGSMVCVIVTLKQSLDCLTSTQACSALPLSLLYRRKLRLLNQGQNSSHWRRTFPQLFTNTISKRKSVLHCVCVCVCVCVCLCVCVYVYACTHACITYACAFICACVYACLTTRINNSGDDIMSIFANWIMQASIQTVCSLLTYLSLTSQLILKLKKNNFYRTKKHFFNKFSEWKMKYDLLNPAQLLWERYTAHKNIPNELLYKCHKKMTAFVWFEKESSNNELLHLCDLKRNHFTMNCCICVTWQGTAWLWSAQTMICLAILCWWWTVL